MELKVMLEVSLGSYGEVVRVRGGERREEEKVPHSLPSSQQSPAGEAPPRWGMKWRLLLLLKPCVGVMA